MRKRRAISTLKASLPTNLRLIRRFGRKSSGGCAPAKCRPPTRNDPVKPHTRKCWRNSGNPWMRPLTNILTQEEHVAGLPLGTRGGILIHYAFPQDAEYEVQIRLTRDRKEEVEGLHEPHQLVLLLDGEQVQSFTVTPAKDKNYDAVDRHLK